MSFKSAEVFMLSNKQKATKNDICLNTSYGPGLTLPLVKGFDETEGTSNKHLEVQHLYITINERPKIGDCYYDTRDKIVSNNSLGITHFSKKIIACTDTSLTIGRDTGKREDGISISLPQPSSSFIDVYIDMYNKNTPITKCLVEYVTITLNENWSERPVIVTNEYQLKVNNNNEITIKRCKESWSKEEVIDIINKFIVEFIGVKGTEDFDYYEKTGDFKEFIKQNL